MNEETLNIYRAIQNAVAAPAMMINGVVSKKIDESRNKREIPGLLGITDDILLYRGRDIMRIMLYYRNIEDMCFGMAGFTNCGDGQMLQVLAGGRWGEWQSTRLFQEEVEAMKRQGWKPLQDVFSILRRSEWESDKNRLFDSSQVFVPMRSSHDESAFNQQAPIVSVVPLGEKHVVHCVESDCDRGFDCGAAYIIFGSTFDIISDKWTYDMENKYGERVIGLPKNFKFHFNFDSLFFPMVSPSV